MRVLYKYCSEFHENLDSSSFDIAEQLSLNFGSQFHLAKVVRLRSKVWQKKKKKFRNKCILNYTKYPYLHKIQVIKTELKVFNMC